MAKTKLSSAKYVERGYGQVEPNHLSAQRNGQIYAQLPADTAIEVLENGQFVKYDYANGVTNFTGAGEWMLVFNEVKIYRDYETNADFAMKKENYAAKVYSPSGTVVNTYASRDYSGITTPADPYEVDSTDNPFQNLLTYHETMMPEGSTMTPRVLKTMIGDIYTTNCVNEETLAVNDELFVGDDGFLTKTAGTNAGTMKWQVVKVYNLPDRQKAVKIMRIA